MISGKVYLVGQYDRYDVFHVNGLISWAERWQIIKGYTREMVAHQNVYTETCFTQVYKKKNQMPKRRHNF